ncbi:MAG: RAMP superfamily CRISPR-associated protein [Candidatus Hadarchaeum sp.]|uniref:RAMP superfamily CRISPR-associated protein n=1 Tax=Candidatus Hadarchaeum sp. TaxID=2883567 RepID=UPI003D0AAC09
MSFGKLESRYRIRGEIETLTPLHIGSGMEEKFSSADLPIVITRDGRPYIPGSSLKGVVRSYAERVLKAVKPSEKVERLVKVTFGYSEREDSQASKLIFRDCLTDSPLKDYRWSVRINRKTKTADSRGLFSYEFVPPGTKFLLEIIGENLSLPELGVLCVGLRPLVEGDGAIGGCKSRGLGAVKLAINSVERVLPEHYINPTKGTEQFDWSVLEERALSALREELGVT